MPGQKFVRLEVAGGDELTDRLRRYLVQSQNSALAAHGVFRIAVSGGSLPKTLGQALRADDKGEFKFEKWRVYLADERAVPLKDEDSNYRLVMAEWVDQIPAGQARPVVVPIDETLLDDLEELADDYRTKMIHEFAERDSVVVPVFDVILLGCGPDGHTCSLFPGHPTLTTTTNQSWVLAVADSPKPPPERVTLSMAVVVHAAHIAFVATGSGKQPILKQIFDVESGSPAELTADQELALLPSSIVNRHGRQVTWFVDEAAVATVDRRAELEIAGRRL